MHVEGVVFIWKKAFLVYSEQLFNQMRIKCFVSKKDYFDFPVE